MRQLNRLMLAALSSVWRHTVGPGISRWLLDLVHQTHYVYGGDVERARIAGETSLMDAVLNVACGTITIEEHVFCGHGVSLLTGSHDTWRRGADRMSNFERQGRDIVVETGVWLASNVTVLGPCRIGAHAVVAAGAVVNRDVLPGEIVGGVPAKHLGWVPGAEPTG